MKLSGEDGWCLWMYESPPIGALIQICREGWGEPSLTKREDCPPELNIYCLYWRLTGIGRRYLDSLPICTAYQQMNSYNDPGQMDMTGILSGANLSLASFNWEGL